MSAWLALAVAATAAVGIIALLGVPIAWALRARGFALAVIAVPAAFAVIAVATMIAPYAGIGWNLLLPAALTAAITLVLLALRRLILPRIPARAPRSGARDLWLGIASAAIAGAAIAIAVASGLGAGNAVSQTFDAGFHLNAVRFILDTGAASPFAMELTSPGVPVFYPTLWHTFVALIVQLTGATIPVATNAAVLATASVVWTVGAVALGRAIAGPSRAATLVSGVAAAAFPNFPLFLVGYGVLYSNLLAYALMPYLLVAGLLLLNLGPARRSLPVAPAGRWLLFLGALGAATLAHPNVIHATIVWAVAPVIWAVWRALRGRPVPAVNGLPALPRTPLWARRTLAIVGLAAFAAVVTAAWVLGRTTDNSWGGRFGPRSVAVQIFGGTPFLDGHAWVISAIILLGVVVAWRQRKLRWVVGSAAALALFYFIADGFPSNELRTLFLSPWYNDPRRLASLVPFGALPLLVIGALSIWAVLRPGLLRFAKQRSAKPRRSYRVMTAFALVLFLAAGQAGALAASNVVQQSYDPKHPVVLSTNERKLLERLADEVPEGEVLANNPLNGSALAYAISGREVLFPHGSGIYGQPGYDLVDSLVADPALACSAAQQLGINYVLDFGTDVIFGPDTPRAVPFKRMKNLVMSPILTEIDREGKARLFRIDGC